MEEQGEVWDWVCDGIFTKKNKNKKEHIELMFELLML